PQRRYLFMPFTTHAPSYISILSLHDALPIYPREGRSPSRCVRHAPDAAPDPPEPLLDRPRGPHLPRHAPAREGPRHLGRSRFGGPRETPPEARPPGR